MAKSKATINFRAVPAVDSIIHITESKSGVSFYEIFKPQRLGANQSELPKQGPETGEYIGYTSINYNTALNLDSNSNGLFTITYTLGVNGLGRGTVTITANFPNAIFVLQQSTADATFISIANELTIPILNITEASTDKCAKAKVNVTTSQLATKILSPYLLNGNTQNPFSFDWVRGENITLTLENASGSQFSQNYLLPSVLISTNFDIQINNSPVGASCIITSQNTQGLNLQYSLDNFTWQTSNVFTGLLTGNYILYIKDHLGRSTEKAFNISDVGVYEPYFYISKANSFRFANRVFWNGLDKHKDDENTLSCEVETKLIYQETQLFNSLDIITTQFRSNYSTLISKVIKEDSSEVLLPITKKTNNIGIKEKRDAIKYNLGSGKTGIYFLSGNIYNFTTNSIIENYTLNGDLPSWAVYGNYINIDNVWHLIDEIIYDYSKNANVIVLNVAYTGVSTNVIASSIYNKEQYEVYEFVVDMSLFLNQKIRVKIQNLDPHFGAITYLSELIYVKENHEYTVDVSYKNSTNTDIRYDTGISHRIRPLLTQVKIKDEDTSENHKTDTNTVLLDSEIYEAEDFIFEPCTKEMVRKIKQALSHDEVVINGVGYVKNGSFNIEQLGNSNLYVLTAPMIKNGKNFNIKTIDSLSVPITIPNILM